MSLALQTPRTGQVATTGQAPSPSKLSLPDAWAFAGYLANSGMIVNGREAASQDQIFTLMMICEAENIHYIEALRQYDIIEGRPAMKAAAIQAKFQNHSGFVEWVRFDEDAAEAMFSHPTLQPKPIRVSVTYDECVKRGIVQGKDGIKKNWRCHRAAMLRARCISAGVRMVYPGIVVGIYTPEELEDMKQETDSGSFNTEKYVNEHSTIGTSGTQEKPIDVTPKAGQQLDLKVIGQTSTGYDDRSYVNVARDAATEGQRLLAQIYESNGQPAPATPQIKREMIHTEVYKAAVAANLTTKQVSTSGAAILVITDDLYPTQRTWVRETINQMINTTLDKVEAAFKAVTQQPTVQEREPGSDG